MAQRKGAVQSSPRLESRPSRTATSRPRRERRMPEQERQDDELKTGSLAPQPAASQSIAEAIGTQVRNLRRKLDLTGAELADQAGLSAGMLSKIENGAVSASIDSLEALARALRSEERRVGKECRS